MDELSDFATALAEALELEGVEIDVARVLSLASDAAHAYIRPAAPVATFMSLVNEGFLISQRGLGACSLAMTEADVDRFVEAVGRVLAARA